MELGTIGDAENQQQLAGHQKELIDKFASSPSQKELETSLGALMCAPSLFFFFFFPHPPSNLGLLFFSSSTSSETELTTENTPERALNPFQQIYVLSSRTFVNFYRDPLLMYTQYGLAVVLACESFLFALLSWLCPRFLAVLTVYHFQV